jgi:hypothetical protein
MGGHAVQAESVNAEALFDQGNVLIQQGKLEQACEAFAALNRAEATAGTMIQLGGCLVRSDRLVSAFFAYWDALRRAKAPAKRKNAGDAAGNRRTLDANIEWGVAGAAALASGVLC